MCVLVAASECAGMTVTLACQAFAVCALTNVSALNGFTRATH
jgi:hypothetical protein